MAAKRLLEGSDSDPDHARDKRMKKRPSFASVIGEVVMVNFFQNFCNTLEPMLRRVVNEEVEHGLRQCGASLTKSPSLRIQALQPSTLKLVFSKKLSLPIFTGSKIVDTKNNNPLHIMLVDTTHDQMVSKTTLSQPIKVEIVVVDGDFRAGDTDTWTSKEFNSNIVKERTGKRPLLTGDLSVTLRDGFASIGDLEFTDNSSWIRSRKFRLGAKVVDGSSCPGVRIVEAMTESFVVKDHRGELYKKHHPPALEDDVWRLEKIGKDGAFHKKLASEGIITVQDFLKLYTTDSAKLKNILGNGMSEKMWEVMVKHAKTCILGNKQYIFRGPHHSIVLNSICQVVKAVINGQTYLNRDLSGITRVYIENLVKDAYANWGSLEEVDGLLNETALLTQGDIVEQYPNSHQTTVRSYQQHGLLTDGSTEMASVAGNAPMPCDEWVTSSAFLYSSTPIGTIQYDISESSPENDLAPTRSFIH